MADRAEVETVKVKFSKGVLEALSPKATTWEAWDTQVPGFGVRISPKGVKSFFLKYYWRGKQQRTRLGRFGAITVDQAREKAETIRVSVRNGQNPSAERREARQAPTVDELVTSFGKHYCDAHLEPGTAKGYKSLLRRWVVPELGKKLVRDVRKVDLVEIHQAHADEPIQANRMLAIAHRMFNYAEDLGYRDENTNPANRIKRYPENPRQTRLSPEQLRAVGRAFREMETTEAPAVDCLRVLLLTGARKNEIRRLRWDQVREDAGKESIVIREHKTKRAIGDKVIPLNSEALSIIQRQPRTIEENPFVFHGKRKDCVYDPHRAWMQIRVLAKQPVDGAGQPQDHADLDAVTVHDLRHTFGSTAIGDAGVDNLVLKDLLGHVDVSTTQRYTHNRITALKVASEATAQAIKKGMEGAG